MENIKNNEKEIKVYRIVYKGFVYYIEGTSLAEAMRDFKDNNDWLDIKVIKEFVYTGS